MSDPNKVTEPAKPSAREFVARKRIHKSLERMSEVDAAALCDEFAAGVTAELRQIASGYAQTVGQLENEIKELRRKLAAKDAEIKRLVERAEFAERVKFGTPCKCDSWIKVSEQAEERAIAAEAREAKLRKWVQTIMQQTTGVAWELARQALVQASEGKGT